MLGMMQHFEYETNFATALDLAHLADCEQRTKGIEFTMNQYISNMNLSLYVKIQIKSKRIMHRTFDID